jgi:hypothetical protein
VTRSAAQIIGPVTAINATQTLLTNVDVTIAAALQLIIILVNNGNKVMFARSVVTTTAIVLILVIVEFKRVLI